MKKIIAALVIGGSLLIPVLAPADPGCLADTSTKAECWQQAPYPAPKSGPIIRQPGPGLNNLMAVWSRR